MKSPRFLLPVALAALLAACASGPPPASEFPAGAKAPSAAEVTALLKGKSFDLSGPGGVRTDYAKEGNAITVYFSGRSDVGTWRAEDGRVCMENFRAIRGACNDVRLIGSDIYVKRSNGQVVKLSPR